MDFYRIAQESTSFFARVVTEGDTPTGLVFHFGGREAYLPLEDAIALVDYITEHITPEVAQTPEA